MTKIGISIFLVLVLLSISCQFTERTKILDANTFNRDSIILDIYTGKQFTPAIRNSITYLKDGYFANISRKSILFYNIKGKLTDSISVSLPSYSFYTWSALDANHFYFLDEEKNSLILVDKTTPRKIWNLNSLPELFLNQFFIIGNPPTVIQDTLFAFYVPKKMVFTSDKYRL